jgi:transglutaminase-like putative cysteine protease
VRRYAIEHNTAYEYESPVVQAYHLAHIRPRELDHQSVESSTVVVRPKPSRTHQSVDYFGNHHDRVEVLEPHDLLEVSAKSRITVTAPPLAANPPTDSVSWNAAVQMLDGDTTMLEVIEYRCDSPLVRSHQRLREYAEPTFAPDRPLVDAVMEFCGRINREFAYEPTATDVSTPLAAVLRDRRGVCQDFAHLAVGCLRSLGLAARYVSGYLETLPPPGRPRLVGADASHAWASVHVPGYGWFDFDPTNDLLPSERHVVVAWGRDFSDVTPLKGVVLGGGAHRLTVGVTVEPIE